MVRRICGTCKYNRTHMGCQNPNCDFTGKHMCYEDTCFHWEEYEWDLTKSYDQEMVLEIQKVDKDPTIPIFGDDEEICPWCGHSRGTRLHIMSSSWERDCDKCGNKYKAEGVRTIHYTTTRIISEVS